MNKKNTIFWENPNSYFILTDDLIVYVATFNRIAKFTKV